MRASDLPWLLQSSTAAQSLAVHDRARAIAKAARWDGLRALLPDEPSGMTAPVAELYAAVELFDKHVKLDADDSVSTGNGAAVVEAHMNTLLVAFGAGGAPTSRPGLTVQAPVRGAASDLHVAFVATREDEGESKGDADTRRSSTLLVPLAVITVDVTPEALAAAAASAAELLEWTDNGIAMGV